MNDKRDIRLVISDLDGTLLDSNGDLPQEVINSIRLIERKGIGFTFISGRPIPFLQEIIHKLQTTLPMGACNGAVVFEKNYLHNNISFSINPLRTHIERALKIGGTVLYHSGDKTYTMSETPWIIEHKGSIREYELHYPTESEWSKFTAEKIVIIFGVTNELHQEFSLKLDQLEEKYSIIRYGITSYEIMADGVSKANAMRMISDILNIPIGQIMTIGDAENDIEMLQLAGLGVAVNNASEATKLSADYICKEKNTEGVIEAMNLFLGYKIFKDD